MGRENGSCIKDVCLINTLRDYGEKALQDVLFIDFSVLNNVGLT